MISQSGESMKKTGLSILVLVMIFLTGCMNFGHLVRDPAEEVFVTVHLRKATESETRGDYLEALKHYKIALTMDSSNPVAAEGRNRVETLLKNSAEESYRRGLEAQKQGRYDDAQREFLTALRLRPGYPEALEKITSRKETEVKGHIVHRIRPGESLSQLALTYYGDPEKYPIIARYNNLRDAKLIRVGQEILIPEPSVGHLSGGASARVSRDPQRRQQGAETSTEEVDPVSVYREQGIELFQEKRFEEALAEFEKVLTARPKDVVAREYSYQASFEIAMAFFENGEYLAARDQFKESQDYKSDCPKCDDYVRKSEDLYKEMHYKKGMQHYGKEQLTEAIMEWEMVKNLDPNYKRVGDYIKKAKELMNKLEYLKMELEERSTSTEQSHLFLNKT
jgi:tetratricopeptide (TPR) repeat protein